MLTKENYFNSIERAKEKYDEWYEENYGDLAYGDDEERQDYKRP